MDYLSLSLLVSATAFRAWNVGGQRPTKIPACLLPLKNSASEAPMEPSVRIWNRLMPVADLVDSSMVRSSDSAASRVAPSLVGSAALIALAASLTVCVAAVADCDIIITILPYAW